MKANILVARNVRRLRVLRELSQEALAVDAKVDRTYVSRVERALENPSVAVLEKLAHALRVEIPDFFDPVHARVVIKPLAGGRKPGRKVR